MLSLAIILPFELPAVQTATMALLSRKPIRATAPGTEMLSSSLLLTGRDSIAVAMSAMAAMLAAMAPMSQSK